MHIKNQAVRLGVNLDHITTVRQARGTNYPDLVAAIAKAEAGGADGITLHLREDRRHIQDADMYQARKHIQTTLNMEMAMTDEMIEIACNLKPDFCCIVPEKRAELTTEGGIDAWQYQAMLKKGCAQLQDNNIIASLFIDPDYKMIECCAEIGVKAIELHTGTYANLNDSAQCEQELKRLQDGAVYANKLGLVVNAGHGLRRDNVYAIASLPFMHELNIGHSIVADALFVGLSTAVREMKSAMQEKDTT